MDLLTLLVIVVLVWLGMQLIPQLITREPNAEGRQRAAKVFLLVVAIIFTLWRFWPVLVHGGR